MCKSRGERKYLLVPQGIMALFFFLFATPAWAYIDPGTGSILLQIILGGIGGVFFAVRSFKAGLGVKIRGLFHRAQVESSRKGHPDSHVNTKHDGDSSHPGSKSA